MNCIPKVGVKFQCDSIGVKDFVLKSSKIQRMNSRRNLASGASRETKCKTENYRYFSTETNRNKPFKELIRVSKLMSERRIASRREADTLIEMRYVKVDGKIVSLGDRVSPDAKIEITTEGSKIRDRNSLTILMNKPYSFVSQSADRKPRQRFASDLLTFDNMAKWCKYKGVEPIHLKKLAVAGRLDADSSGLLIFSQDGNLCREIISPSHIVEKEYIVRVRPKGSRIDMFDLNTRNSIRYDPIPDLCCGLSLDGRKLKPAKVEWINENQMRFVLKEGRNRQIRRMCDLVGLDVDRLHRVRIGNIKLGGLEPGYWTTFSGKVI